MSVDLNALAHQIANELAKGDLARPTPPGGASTLRLDGAPVPPRGVLFADGSARLGDFIDHTLLGPDVRRGDVERHCAEAIEHRFAAVCVAPIWVSLCRALLAQSSVAVATVVGFPAGATRSEVKALEARVAADDGADELDVAAPLGLVKGGEWRDVAADIGGVVRAAQGRLVKVIIETAALTPAEVLRASSIALDEGAHYVKTSSGAHPAGGATPEAVALVRLVCGDAMGVKASGGIRDAARAFALIASGATRIGTSHGVAMAAATGPGPQPVGALFGGVGSSIDPASRDAGSARPGARPTPAPGGLWPAGQARPASLP